MRCNPLLFMLAYLLAAVFCAMDMFEKYIQENSNSLFKENGYVSEDMDVPV